MRKQAGFTLVELIVVIVILGILSATALPKFINVSSDARTAAVNGIAGSLRSAIGLVQSKYYASGNVSPVTMSDGTTVAVLTTPATLAGTPTAAGIVVALPTPGITPTTSGTVVTWQPSGGSATCQVTYDGSSGAITSPTSGC